MRMTPRLFRALWFNVYYDNVDQVTRVFSKLADIRELVIVHAGSTQNLLLCDFFLPFPMHLFIEMEGTTAAKRCLLIRTG
ncbi:hypothetical protein DTL21_20835 [Bremerella cremea]|uniref:Uncharacterized protein n=1 Tax=Blastopirellula marina TaxID=124 RepID=A0A2S8FKE0_9BACT|nr:hypothetical protein C5Y83_20815 [Blastopirellula marina]RCS45715.1 hypothetical protein DTL21_20835 [Bremerella cremea]